MAKIFVDGIEYEVDEKKRLIDALREKGVEIPHYCYHPKLSVVGMCRMCLIEIEGVPKFQIACNTAIKDGMKITAFSEKVKKAREGVLEFLLINHPLDCPVCDKSGECGLQDYTFTHGNSTTRFREHKRNTPQEKIGTNLLINHNRCIMCYRCVRFDKEVVGIPDLEMVARGNDTYIAYTAPETEGEKPPYLSHNYQGSLTDICPVGAMLNENTLFQSRVWWYDSTDSYCHGCSTLCKISADVKANSLYRYMPRRLPSLQHVGEDYWGSHDYFICDYGRFSSRDFSKDRLNHYIEMGVESTSAKVLPKLWEKIQNAQKIVILGGATESCEDIDAIVSLVATWEKEGKKVEWDFRSTLQAFHKDETEKWDFLLSKDLRPNAKHLRELKKTSFASFSELSSAVINADLVLVLNELSAPFAYQTGVVRPQVKGLKVPAKVEESALFNLLNGGNSHAAVWGKVALFTTHENTAAHLAALSLPVLAFPEKKGMFRDKNGETKEVTPSIKPIYGLVSIKEVLYRAKAQVQEQVAV